jgi:hypothetical protein
VFGFGRRRQVPASPELGALGTHAFVVTDWSPQGDTSNRPVLLGDVDAIEPVRKTFSTKGPLAFHGDQNIQLFQGEKAPRPEEYPEPTQQSDDMEALITTLSVGGYPS